MDSPLLINQVIHLVEKDLDYRVLWNSEPAFWICLTTRANVPRRFSPQEIQDGISSGLYTFVPDLWLVRSGLQDVSASAIQTRDRIWDLIGRLVTNPRHCPRHRTLL